MFLSHRLSTLKKSVSRTEKNITRKVSSVIDQTTEPNKSKPYNEIPTVSGIPFLRDIKAAKEVFGIEGIQYCEKYGDIIRFNIFSKKFVALFSPELVKEFLAYEPGMPEGIASTLWSIEYRNEIMREEGRFNAIATSGIEWKKARDYFQNYMFSPKDSQFYFPHIDRSAVSILAELEKIEGQEHLQDTLMKVAFELFHGFMYGNPSNIFDKNVDPDYLTLLYSSKEWITAIAQLGRYQPWMTFLPYVKSRISILKEHTLKSSRAWDALGEKRILDMMKGGDELAMTSYVAKIAKSDDDLAKAVHSTGDFLSAAVDTTSSALVWLLYHSAANPEKQEELFQQIDKELKGEGLTCQEDADRIPLLNGFIKESQRLNPVTSGTIRTYDQDVIVKGYSIPAGTTVFVSPSYTTGRNPDVFESPRSFIPERWLPEAKSARRKNKQAFPHDSPFTLMQFSIGPRMCLGSRIAHVELLCILARIVQKYKVSFAEGKPIPSFDISSQAQGLSLPDPYPFLKFTSRN